MLKTSIIVAVKDNIGWTQHCLESIKENTDIKNNELIVINNGSIKSMSKKLEEILENLSFDNIKYIHNEDNNGSYYAWNQGIDESEAEYVCIMHNDCIVSKNWLETLLNTNVDQYDSPVGIISPSTNYADELDHVLRKDIMDLSTNFKYSNKISQSYLSIKEMLTRVYPDGLNHFLNVLDKNEDVKISHNIASFCFLAKKELYEEYGKFDLEFYPHRYSEKLLKHKMDVDGLLTLCNRNAFIHHNGNTTSDGVGFSLDMIEYTNKKIYENKMNDIYESNMMKPY